MGAKHAPSIANIFVAKWEAKCVLEDKPRELMCYKWFIEDIPIIWNGSGESLNNCMTELQGNNRNTELTWKKKILRASIF